MANGVQYVKSETTRLYRAETGSDWATELLWGDRAWPLGVEQNGRVQVRARGRKGWVKKSALGSRSLLELYFIDVGQGDGVLIRTPDDRHILIDGGYPRAKQPTGKNAADFVDWKFHAEYGMDTIALDAVLCSHNDEDHYGGLSDLLDVAQASELDCKHVTVGSFHHAGLSWWKGPSGRTLGPSVQTELGAMYTRLLDDRASAVAALADGASPALQGEWGKFIERVTQAQRGDGTPTPMSRLTHSTGHLPGFGPADGDTVIRVLGPVEFDVGGKPAIRRYAGGDDKNTNGNSVLLRLDYEDVRVLLTGDLNTVSQRALLSDYAGQETDFACDIAKCCHHGSADVSLRFLEHVNPTVTVISSGDSEGHDHPRPNILAAAGLTGHRTVSADGDQLLTPLVYCTELARSTGIGTPTRLVVNRSDGTAEATYTKSDFRRMRVTYDEVKAGDIRKSTRTRGMAGRKVVSGIIYGLVNVRTDGKKILCATLNEKKGTWNVETVQARF